MGRDQSAVGTCLTQSVRARARWGVARDGLTGAEGCSSVGGAAGKTKERRRWGLTRTRRGGAEFNVAAIAVALGEEVAALKSGGGDLSGRSRWHSELRSMEVVVWRVATPRVAH
jgi:hypothetical protein